MRAFLAGFGYERWVLPALLIIPLVGVILIYVARIGRRRSDDIAAAGSARVIALVTLIVEFLVPKLEKSTTLYGSLGAMTTLLFFMYLVGRLVVTSPILNSSLHHELRTHGDAGLGGGTAGQSGGSAA